MPQYIGVFNRPNRIATVHLSNCSFLGPSPLENSLSAQRRSYDDALEAILAAGEAVPDKFGLCGHCLNRYKKLRFV